MATPNRFKITGVTILGTWTYELRIWRQGGNEQDSITLLYTDDESPGGDIAGGGLDRLVDDLHEQLGHDMGRPGVRHAGPDQGG